MSLKPITKILMTIMLLCLAIIVHASAITVDGIVYQLVGTSAYLYDGKNQTSTDVIIPYSITYNGEEYVVKNIQSNAFSKCDRIHSVVIPDGVVSVGESVFANCENLETVAVGNGLEEIGKNMFYNCANLSSISLGKSIASIGNNSFERCIKLDKIILPDRLTKIGYYAFSNCRISEIEMPNNIQSIGANAFYGCRFSTFNWPANITELPNSVFAQCTNLKTIYLPEGLEKIGSSAFSRCSKLSNIKLPKTLKIIESGVFYYCSSIGDIKLPESLQSIGSSAFAWSGVSSLFIPGSVTKVGIDCFKYSELKKITFADGVIEIGTSAFYGSTVNEIVFGRTVKSVGPGDLFSKCFNLKTIVCKSNVVPNYLYSGCKYSFDWLHSNIAFLIPLGTKENYDPMRDFFNIIEVAMDDLDEGYPTDSAPGILVSSIVLSPSPIEGKEGDHIQINTTILPEDATNKVIDWSSSDESIATVDNNGVVSLIKEGTATITASATDDSGVAATCSISVLKPAVFVSSISLSPSSAEGTEGDRIQLNATVLPEDATNKVIRWSSSDENIASVDDSGLISLLEKGTAVITASATDDSGVSADCAIVVSEVSGIEDVLADKSSYVKIFNLKGILIFEGKYADAHLIPDYYIVVCDGRNIKVKVQ